MKVLSSILLITLFSICSAQATKVDIVDFYKWNGASGNKYEVMIVTEDFRDEGATPATLRVRYPRGNGSYNIVEFYSDLYYEFDEDSNMLIYLMAVGEASYIQGAGTYSPDNFVMKFDAAGYLLSGLQADNNELEKPEDQTEYADLSLIEYGDSENLKSLIRNFYNSSDPLYRELMAYADKF
jgi:hypothetical protein